MKKLCIALFAVAGLAVTANAQEVERDSAAVESSAISPDQENVTIKTEELPEAVKQTLADQEYKGWIINTAVHNRKDDHYEVELKNGADTQVVKFNSEGQRLDD